MNGNRRLVLLAVLGALFFGLPSLVTFYTDWLWFAANVFSNVYPVVISS